MFMSNVSTCVCCFIKKENTVKLEFFQGRYFWNIAVFGKIHEAKKNKSYVLKLPRAFVFWCAFDSPKFKVWIFFACFIFFPDFYELACQNKQQKIWQTKWNTEQQTFSTMCSVLYRVHPKIKFHISKLWPTQIWHVCCSGKKKLLKKTYLGQVFQSVTSFETYHLFFLACVFNFAVY